MATVFFLGSDELEFKGFTARKVNNIQHWINQVTERIELEFKENGKIKVHTSNNEFTTFESVKDIMDKIIFVNITEAQFNTLNDLFGIGFFDEVQYGNDVGFLGYKYPKPVGYCSDKIFEITLF